MTKLRDDMSKKFAILRGKDVCSVLKPAFGHDTLHELQEKTPVGSVVFDKQFWLTTDAVNEMRQHDEWLNIQEHSFSAKNIGQYFRICKP